MGSTGFEPATTGFLPVVKVCSSSPRYRGSVLLTNFELLKARCSARLSYGPIVHRLLEPVLEFLFRTDEEDVVSSYEESSVFCSIFFPFDRGILKPDVEVFVEGLELSRNCCFLSSEFLQFDQYISFLCFV